MSFSMASSTLTLATLQDCLPVKATTTTIVAALVCCYCWPPPFSAFLTNRDLDMLLAYSTENSSSMAAFQSSVSTSSVALVAPPWASLYSCTLRSMTSTSYLSSMRFLKIPLCACFDIGSLSSTTHHNASLSSTVASLCVGFMISIT